MTEGCFHTALITVSANTRELHLPHSCCVMCICGISFVVFVCVLVFGYRYKFCKHCARKWIHCARK